MEISDPKFATLFSPRGMYICGIHNSFCETERIVIFLGASLFACVDVICIANNGYSYIVFDVFNAIEHNPSLTGAL